MIKLQDFARECGVTDRAIQKHLKTYAEELEGLYQRTGPNGTWLSDAACQILRGKMKRQPVVVGNDEDFRKKDELSREVDDLKDKLILAMERVQEQQALLNQNQVNQLMLQAAEEKAEKAVAELAEANQKLGAARQEALQAKERAEAEEHEKREALEAKSAADARIAELEAELAKPIKFFDWLSGRRKK